MVVVVVRCFDGEERLLSRQIDVNRSGQVPRRLKLNQVWGSVCRESHHNTLTKKSTVQFRNTDNNKQKEKRRKEDDNSTPS